jgi:hypothetical protein
MTPMGVGFFEPLQIVFLLIFLYLFINHIDPDGGGDILNGRFSENFNSQSEVQLGEKRPQGTPKSP